MDTRIPGDGRRYLHDTREQNAPTCALLDHSRVARNPTQVDHWAELRTLRIMRSSFRTNTRILALVLLSASCAGTHRLPSGRAAALGFSESELARIQPALQAYVDSGKYAGIYAVIVRHGQIAYEQAVGYADVAKGKRLGRDDVFRIYSMTKPVVSAGLLKLVDQRKVQLDDPVSKYIPAFANMNVYVGGSADQPQLRAADSQMTVRQLLTHTSGLGYGTTSSPVDTIFLRAKLYDASHTLEQFADSLAKLPLMFSPGTGWNYSSGIDVVARVIEVASGKPLDRFLHDEIFEPLDMQHTGFRKQGYLRKHLAALYERGPDGRLQPIGSDGLQAMYEPNAKFLWGSGGLLSTVDDYLRFTQMLLNHGELNGVRVLSRESVDAMSHNQLPAFLTPLKNRPSYERGYGYGLAVSVLVDSTQATLPGPNGIYRWSGYVGTYFWIDPANDMVAMVWSQLSPGRRYPLEQEFQKLVYGALR